MNERMVHDDYRATFLPLVQCSSCDTSLSSDAVTILSRTSSRSLVHVHCQSCERSMLLRIDAQRDTIVCFGTLTDCSVEDMRCFSDAPVISVDDVLLAHQYLSLDNRGELR